MAGRGRPKHQPTDQFRRQVKTMAGFGIHQDEIANLLDIAAKTLRLHYRRELDTGATEANVRVANSLYTMAVQDKIPSAAIFWLKVRAGWTEPPVVQNTTVIVGGIDRPAKVIDGYAEWLDRARSDLEQLEHQSHKETEH